MNLASVLVLIDAVVVMLLNTMHNVVKRGYYKELTSTVRHCAIVFGLATIFMFAIQSITNTDEHNMAVLKETTEAALEDSLDLEFQSSYGLPRMDKDKFVESFLRRFANNVDGTRTYDVKFIDLNEIPPKVSVKIDSNTVLSYNGEDSTISTQIDQIVETNALNDYNIQKQLGN